MSARKFAGKISELVLEIVRAHPEGIARGVLAKAAGLTHRQVTNAIDLLKTYGLVRSRGQSRSARYVPVVPSLAKRAPAAVPPAAPPSKDELAADRALVAAWLKRNRPTQCPPCGAGQALPHYDDRFVGLGGYNGTRALTAISFANMRQRARFARAAARRRGLAA